MRIFKIAAVGAALCMLLAVFVAYPTSESGLVSASKADITNDAVVQDNNLVQANAQVEPQAEPQTDSQAEPQTDARVDAQNNAPDNLPPNDSGSPEGSQNVAANANDSDIAGLVLADDEVCRITVIGKSVDKYGDAGYTLWVENRLPNRLPNGLQNHLSFNPLIWTWTVDGVQIDAAIEGNVFNNRPKALFLYFDDLDSVDQLKSVKGTLQVFDTQSWWNPVKTYEVSF